MSNTAGIIVFTVALATFIFFLYRYIVVVKKKQLEEKPDSDVEKQETQIEAEAEEISEASEEEKITATEKTDESEPEKTEAEIEGEKAEVEKAEEVAEKAEVKKAEVEKAEDVAEKAEVEKAEDVEVEKAEAEIEAEKAKKEEKKTPKTLKEGLKKTRKGFISRIGKLFSFKKEIDEDILEELEEVLFTSDIGPQTANKLMDIIKDKLSRKELGSNKAIWQTLREVSLDILDIENKPFAYPEDGPFVILVVGVNGVGKTTTIGKMALRLKNEGKSVLLAAGDTFRAAAIEQLEVWARDRVQCEFVRGKEKADPSSVIFDAIKKAKKENIDVVIADTAGRLHTKVNLMEELKKIRRTCNKASEGAPHETFLVLDATNGQNALHQADIFKKAMDFSGIIITKMDGTAKGGVILGICDKMKVPVKYIGIGEQVEDLRVFDAEDFVVALYDEEE
ncbi:MAG: signal recognition particle-docking protein FtsY [Myxococcota bacterium]